MQCVCGQGHSLLAVAAVPKKIKILQNWMGLKSVTQVEKVSVRATNDFSSFLFPPHPAIQGDKCQATSRGLRTLNNTVVLWSHNVIAILIDFGITSHLPRLQFIGHIVVVSLEETSEKVFLIVWFAAVCFRRLAVYRNRICFIQQWLDQSNRMFCLFFQRRIFFNSYLV